MRIIAGIYKGRVLLPPPGAAPTRPITGSVKKSLFGMLGEDLSNQVVLDLFCGTGTLGIEALSRGASRVYFADMGNPVLDRLLRNLQDCRAVDKATIWRGDVLKSLGGWVREVAGPVDVAFVDPPYAMVRSWDWNEAGRQIFEPLAGVLAADGVVTLRCDDQAKTPERIGALEVVRERQYGSMRLALLSLAR